MDAAALFAAGAGAGLLAGATSCAAVQLGLLAGAVRDARRPAGPVAAFLGAKLAVHTALGAVLGALGRDVQPGPHWRGAFLMAAAAVLLLFALDLAGVPRPAWTRARRNRPTHDAACAALPARLATGPATGGPTGGAADGGPADGGPADGGAAVAGADGGPADGGRARADGADSDAAGAGAAGGGTAGADAAGADAAGGGTAGGNTADADAAGGGTADSGTAGGGSVGVCGGGRVRFRRPVVVGAATLLVPCGLTLSAELLAVSSRSPVGGAAVLAGFVLGTVPVFAVAGLAAGRVLRALRGRLTVLVAAAMVLTAGWTLLAGLRLGGWLPDGGGTASAEVSARFVRTDASGTQIVTVWALTDGYRPALLTARAGVPTVLEIRTERTHGHTRVLTIPSLDRDVALPETGTTRVALGVPGRGRLRFTCASGHYPGAVTFR